MSEDRAEDKISPCVSEEGEEGEILSKRRRQDEDFHGDNEDSVDHPSLKRRAGSHEVLFRIVVPSRRIGKVIGKEGSQIQKIREETKANIKIADAVARHEDRVIIISSRHEESEISDAENALCHIATVILKDDDEIIEPSKVGAVHAVANTIRLLIAGSQAGCLIGKSGQNIEKIRNLSGAAIMILAQNQLPLCASAHESDRLVQISGDLPQVLKALELIGCELRFHAASLVFLVYFGARSLASSLHLENFYCSLCRENPQRKVVSIRPIYNLGSNGSTQPYLPQAPTPANYVTMEMTILEKLVGGLIGKSGLNISRIRNESGATIKVSGSRRHQELRQIHFAGSAEQVTLARKLVDEYIFAQSI